jgi:hypothetical protein
MRTASGVLPRARIFLLGALAIPFLLSGAAVAQHELFKILPSDGAATDLFGMNVSADAGRAVVGSPGDDDNGSFSGSAYVFDVATGQELRKLHSSDGAPSDSFGSAVAIDWNRIVVSAPWNDDWAADSGSAYIFDVDTGQQLFKLGASDAGAGDHFGDAVAIGGNLVVIGAPEQDTVGYNAGAAYVFDVRTGQELFKLLASDGEGYDRFGKAVAVSGTRIAIGSPHHDTQKGVVYLFDGVTGRQLSKLVSLDIGFHDGFGGALSACGDHLAIGATGNGDAGAVYIFDLTIPQQLHKLAPSDGQDHDIFGIGVACSESQVVVGSFQDNLQGTNEGSAYFFDLATGQELFKLIPSDGESYDRCGRSVGLSGDRAIVAAAEDDDLGGDSGSVYVFDVSERMIVTPASPLELAGSPGGPFHPETTDYTIHNSSTADFDYLVTSDSDWLSVTGGAGSVPAAGTAMVSVSVNPLANSLGIGLHSGQVSIVNTTTHAGDTVHEVELLVEEGQPRLIHQFTFDTDPGWSREWDWEFGVPLGNGSYQIGGPDPDGAFTGSNVFGYNLSGDYDDDMSPRSLTTVPLDCSDSTGTTLKFWRWLNVEDNQYDEAAVEISNDGSNWTTVWVNGNSVYEDWWTHQEYDISAIADGESTVYLRWVMGPTDYILHGSGWNIDDVEIWSEAPAPPGQGFCFGDLGYGTSCPCTNDNDGTLPGAGCANGVHASGAYLTATGSASVTGDTLVLRTTHGEPNNSGLYFQGTTNLAGGLLWGDGLRCTGGGVRRLQVRFADTDGSSLTTIPIGTAGGVSAGDRRYYQLWYRNIVAPPCGAGVNDFNSSNGYVITWQP